jgi:RAB protein geranylgeranyltransferase component A
LETDCYYGGEYAALNLLDFFNENSICISLEHIENVSLDIKVKNDTIETDISNKTEDLLIKYAQFAEKDEWNGLARKKASFFELILSKSRHFLLELIPMVLFCKGPMVDIISNSGVGPALEFQLVKALFCLDNNSVFKVPGGKEDVFANDSISLIDKRRIMKFFTYALEFNPEIEIRSSLESISFLDYLRQQKIPEPLGKIILSSIVFETDLNRYQKMNAFEGIKETQKHLQSIGVYGPGALLTALYGTGSELCQAFSRYCAVYGGIYILDFDLQSISQNSKGWVVNSKNEEFSAKHIIVSSRYSNMLDNNAIKKPLVHRLIVISNEPFVGMGEHSVITTHPNKDTNESGIFLMQQNSENQVCPDGFCISLVHVDILHVWSDAQKTSMESVKASISSITHGIFSSSGSFILISFTTTAYISPIESLNLSWVPSPNTQIDCDYLVSSSYDLFHSFSDAEFYPKKPFNDEEE